MPPLRLEWPSWLTGGPPNSRLSTSLRALPPESCLNNYDPSGPNHRLVLARPGGPACFNEEFEVPVPRSSDVTEDIRQAFTKLSDYYQYSRDSRGLPHALYFNHSYQVGCSGGVEGDFYSADYIQRQQCIASQFPFRRALTDPGSRLPDTEDFRYYRQIKVAIETTGHGSKVSVTFSVANNQ
jgi:hypothetical protein